ncbi:MAG: hypothetical protein LBN28_03290, partial [Desulfovibrio sp.]|nr:hypothetical protein [Desulfovibrio sp.]
MERKTRCKLLMVFLAMGLFVIWPILTKADGLTISGTVSGTVTMDTSSNAGTLNIVAINTRETILQNNTITDPSRERYNSISFQPITGVNSVVNAVLNISTTDYRGTVSLLDPVYAKQNNGKTFTMNVSGPGQFNWSGDNEFIVGGVAANNAVNLRSGSNTTLLDGFKLTALNHSFNLSSGATLTVHRNTSIVANAVTLNGNLIFDLDGINNIVDPMLRITSDKIDIGRSTAALARPGDLTPLKAGDKFYLINGSTDLLGVFAGEATTQVIKHGSLLEATVNFLQSDKDLVAEVIGKSDGPGDPDPPNPYSNNEITTNIIHGGGVLGGYGTTNLGNLEKLTFANNKVIVSDYIAGGGVLGVVNHAVIGNITDTIFDNNVITANKAGGGGILGAYSGGTIGDISDSKFTDNTITANNIWGGGILGTDGDNATIGDVNNVTFTNNTITTKNFFGGGIIGINRGGSFGNISNSKFADNVITAESFIRAGVVFSTNDLSISDSQFTDNTATAIGIVVHGGAVTMDTSSNAGTLNIVATAGKETIFRNNKITDPSGERYNAISFKPAIDGNSAVDAVLNISGAGTVSLYDPIYVNQNNGKTFTMNVTANQFNWGGDNEFIVSAVDT